jgi:NAD(P)H-flavin reductase
VALASVIVAPLYELLLQRTRAGASERTLASSNETDQGSHGRKTYVQAAIVAGYPEKNARQSGFQTMQQIRAR